MARDYLVLAPVNMPDGFDLLATSFAAPPLPRPGNSPRKPHWTF